MTTGINILTNIEPDPNILNQHLAWPNIYNRYWPQASNPFLLPQVSALAPQLFPTNAGLLQLTYGLHDIHQVPPALVAILQGYPQLLQQMPQTPKLSLTNARAPWNIANRGQAFKTGVTAPKGPSEMLTPGLLRRACRKHWPFYRSTYWCACFNGHMDCAPISFKINVMGSLTFFVIIPWLRLRTNPRTNHLNMTAFS